MQIIPVRIVLVLVLVRIMPVFVRMPMRIMPVLVLQGDLDLFLAATFTATFSRLAGLGDTCSGDKGERLAARKFLRAALVRKHERGAEDKP